MSPVDTRCGLELAGAKLAANSGLDVGEADNVGHVELGANIADDALNVPPRVTFTFPAVGGAYADMDTAVHADVDPVDPDAQTLGEAGLLPMRYITEVLFCVKASGYLFAVASVRTHPTRRRYVYPEGIAGAAADRLSKPAVVVPLEITHTLYHALAADIPVSRPFAPDDASDGDTDTELTSSGGAPAVESRAI